MDRADVESMVYNGIRDGIYDAFKEQMPLHEEILMAIADGVREAMEAMGNAAMPQVR